MARRRLVREGVSDDIGEKGLYDRAIRGNVWD